MCKIGRLDEQGRQVDAEGKLVRQGPVLTLKANRLGGKAHNPYLQHSTVSRLTRFYSVLHIKNRGTGSVILYIVWLCVGESSSTWRDTL